MNQTINLDSVGISRVYELVSRMSSDGFELRDGSRLVRCPSLSHPIKKDKRDANPSCKINPHNNAWHCYACGAGGKILALIIAAGKSDDVEKRTDKVGRPLSPEARALLWLEQALGQQSPTLEKQPEPQQKKQKSVKLDNERFVAEYAYRDADGVVRYYLLRIVGDSAEGLRDKRFEFMRPIEPKSFEREWNIETRLYVTPDGDVAFTLNIIGGVTGPQRGIRAERLFPDGRVEHVARNRDGVEIIPYHLNEVVAAAKAGRTIILLEGEQDADTLRSLDFIATSTPFGASFLPPESWKAYFAGAAYLACVSDADSPGRRSAQRKVDVLTGAAQVTALCDLWPDRTDGFDVTNYAREQRAAGTPDSRIRKAIIARLRGPLLNAREHGHKVAA